MANIILSEQFTEFEGPAPDQRWSDWLVMMCARLRQAMLAHREGARVVAGATLGRAVMLAQLLDLAIRSLMAAGLPLRLAYLTCMTSISYVYGFVIEEQAAPEAEVVSHIEASDESIVAAILRENQANNYDADADFKAGLELIIEGVQRKAIMLS
jgi:TetR/AcrR family tetracycline transcriptional repressor